MAEVTQHRPGDFCWVELATTDPATAAEVYGRLFGWTAEPRPVAPGMTYATMNLGDRAAAGLYRMRDDQRALGAHPAWMVYVTVARAEDTAVAASRLGGTVLAGPVAVGDAGCMAIIQDPTGARFGIWQPDRQIGARVVREPGAFTWAELQTRDPKAA